MKKKINNQVSRQAIACLFFKEDYVMEIKDKILFIGVGQGGGNLCQELELRGYRTLAINTSKEDLNTLTFSEAQISYHWW